MAYRDRHVSLWPSVSVCSLIRPGNSTGPRSEGEQRYQMDSGRGSQIGKNWTERGRERELERDRPEEETNHTYTRAQTTLGKMS